MVSPATVLMDADPKRRWLPQGLCAFGTDQAIEEDVFQAPPAVEDREDYHSGAVDAVDHPIGRNNQLAVLADVKPTEFGNDAPSFREGRERPDASLEAIERGKRSLRASVRQIRHDPFEISPR
jgi:hypothetical protein